MSILIMPVLNSQQLNDLDKLSSAVIVCGSEISQYHCWLYNDNGLNKNIRTKIMFFCLFSIQR